MEIVVKIARAFQICFALMASTMAIAETTKTVDYWATHSEERSAKLAQCKKHPGTLDKTANCMNAKTANKPEVSQPSVSANEIPPPSKLTRDFYSAFTSSNWEIVEMLVTQGADVNCRNCGGVPLLHYSMYQDMYIGGAINRVDWLIAHGANLNTQAVGSGDTALNTYLGLIGDPYTMFNIQGDATALVSKLIIAGADVKIADKNGVTPLHLAASSIKAISNTAVKEIDRYRKLIDILVANGGNVNATTIPNGLTPLMVGVSVSYGSESACNQPIVEHLISKGADISIATSKGVTAYDFVYELAVAGNKQCNGLLPILKGGVKVSNAKVPM